MISYQQTTYNYDHLLGMCSIDPVSIAAPDLVHASSCRLSPFLDFSSRPSIRDRQHSAWRGPKKECGRDRVQRRVENQRAMGEAHQASACHNG
jgi:hypothetical protein